MQILIFSKITLPYRLNNQITNEKLFILNAIKLERTIFNNEEIIALINLYKSTLSDKDIVTKISNKFNLSKRVIYQLIIDNK